MAISKTAPLVFLVLFCANALIFTNTMVSAQCQGDFNGLMQRCARFVQAQGPKTQPDQPCCDVVKSMDLACVCAHLPPDVGTVISMEKAVFVASSCGNPVKSGTKCGSYMVPP